MDIMQSLYSLWASSRTPSQETKVSQLLPDKEAQRQLCTYVEEAEKRAFAVGFKAALGLVQQLDGVEDI
ncbi:hypothetical protein [Blautia wexlerae]|uniref:hypothetical protein n=1 Tax=Blautia wexlerae TaxID=418240 RepID=UPI00156FF1D5|nr:hypothetical protein [Blautia wexlerae]NSF38544.1 hypothetical protein [Blautia wexlerae]